MTIHEATTHLAAAEVVERARTFFAGIRSPNAAAEEARGTMHLRFHLDMGEIVIGAIPVEGGTRVRGSGSRGAAHCHGSSQCSSSSSSRSSPAAPIATTATSRRRRRPASPASPASPVSGVVGMRE